MFSSKGTKSKGTSATLSAFHFTINRFKAPFWVLVISIHLYGCETRALLADSEKKKKKRIQNFETKCLRKLLRLLYMERKTNDWVRSKINFLADPHEPLLAAVK